MCVVGFDGWMFRLARICVGYDGMMDVVFVYNIPPIANVIWRQGHSLVSFDILVKPGIKPATPGLQGEWFIHYTTAAEWFSWWVGMVDRWIGRCVDGWMERWKDGCSDRSTDGWIDVWTDGQMNGWVDACMHKLS